MERNWHDELMEVVMKEVREIEAERRAPLGRLHCLKMKVKYCIHNIPVKIRNLYWDIVGYDNDEEQ